MSLGFFEIYLIVLNLIWPIFTFFSIFGFAWNPKQGLLAINIISIVGYSLFKYFRHELSTKVVTSLAGWVFLILLYHYMFRR